MGTWGTQPLENDPALDLKGDWEDSGDLSVLTEALDLVLETEENDVVDAMDAEAAIGAISIILSGEVVTSTETKTELLQKSAAVLGRVVENSELQELWAETESLGDWLQSITNLMQQIVEQLQQNE
jgi:hypothetical protein